MTGGEDAFKKTLINVFTKIKDARVDFSSSDVGQAYSYMRSEQREFFLVDVALTLVKGEGK